MAMITTKIRTTAPAMAPTIGAMMFGVEELLLFSFGAEVVDSLEAEDGHIGSLKDCRST